MLILTNLSSFSVPQKELIHIYTLYIQSVVEQACIVWHSSITKGESYDLERIQKVALKEEVKEEVNRHLDLQTKCVLTPKQLIYFLIIALW